MWIDWQTTVTGVLFEGCLKSVLVCWIFSLYIPHTICKVILEFLVWFSKIVIKFYSPWKIDLCYSCFVYSGSWLNFMHILCTMDQAVFELKLHQTLESKAENAVIQPTIQRDQRIQDLLRINSYRAQSTSDYNLKKRYEVLLVGSANLWLDSSEP